MKIVKFEETDIEEIVSLFYGTVHSVCLGDYTLEEVSAWAPTDEKENKVEIWKKSLSRNITFVAKDSGQIVGFGDITHQGLLVRLYVHKDFQGQRIASALVKRLESEVMKLNLPVIETEASITAKSFFESREYEVVRAQTVVRRDVALTNYKMLKKL